MRGARWLVLVSLAVSGCRPASVESVHQWLLAYAEGDAERMVEHTWSGDRELVGRAMKARETSATSTLAMALPPRPIEHELVEIEKKEPGRHTVLTVIQMKNPLPYVSKKVGQDLPDVPKVRPERRRFLAVQEGERWGVKLDLAAALARVRFVEAFERVLAKGDLERARAMLEEVPAPPDEANALQTRDRLKEALTERIAEVEARRAQRAADAAPYHCFAWVHGSDFGTDCETTKEACALARARAGAEHREIRACKPASEAVCFEGAAGTRCFGDHRTCVEASARVGVILKLCAPSKPEPGD